jgi:spoIIIJ-associated protein
MMEECMPDLEFEGKNVKNAVETASRKLDIPKDELRYNVLSHGSSGIFGLGAARKARIRVTLDDAPPPAETGEPDNDSLEGGTVGFELRDENVSLSAGEQQVELPDDPKELGHSVLQRIVNTLTSDARISVEEDADRIHFNVVGGNSAILIGKRGQTLEAIQSLVEKVVNKHNGNRIRVQVDVAGYLETRKENLEKMAMRLAEKSKRIRKPIALGQMNAYDRRIVHLALKDDADVSTRSRGEGYLRKLVIFPKKNNDHKRRSTNQ